MASPWNMYTSCLRATTYAAARTARTRASMISATSRAYNRASVAATPNPLYLDFLAPSVFRGRPRLSAAPRASSANSPAKLPSQRSLATTSNPSAAKPAQPVLNPRKDDAGKTMTISISPRASHRIHAISTGDKNPNLALRVTVESGGCHGFQYLMDLTDLGEKPATEEDTVFQGEKGEKVVIDESSLELLNGSTVDYTMELIGSQFKVTGIPGATSSCGCGTSFDIKL